MPIRANWGIVAVACGFVVLAIGVAVGTAYYQKAPSTPTTITADASGQNSYSDSDWKSTLATIATSTIDANGNFVAPVGLSPTEVLSQALLVKYLQINKDGNVTEEEKSAAIRDIITQNVKPITPNTTYTLGNIRTSKSAPLNTYAGALANALNKSRAVTEYELQTFSRTTGLDNYNGTPQLVAAGGIYRTIERDLTQMQVPSALANEHLALLQNVSMLAQATNLMGTWSGDPITALADMDAFIKADRATQVAITNLFSKINKLAKTS